MIDDTKVRKAVASVLQRSERQTDLDKLVGTFVDIGVLPQIENDNNQIIYGRRGTGKTHVLKVLQSNLLQQGGSAVVYIDARTLGSSSQFSDPTVPLKHRCLALFRDVLGEIYNVLLEYIVENPSRNSERALEALDELRASITEPGAILSPSTLTTETSNGSAAGASLGLNMSIKEGIAGKADVSRQAKHDERVTTNFTVTRDDKVLFPSLFGALKDVLRLADTKLWILLDEWSSLPHDIQPYLAEFFRRGVLPVSEAVVKIAALEYRSNFKIRQPADYIGFEIGADLSATLDLDDYYVYDRNPEQITNAFGDMLYRHLNSELPDGYLRDEHRVRDGGELSSRLFTERKTFQELVRAAEGVARDLINIFTAAFFNAQRRGRSNIDRRAILDAARQWFEQDKAKSLDEDLQGALRGIVDEVIGTRRARSFMLARDLEMHPIVQRLFDARVLHNIVRGYSDRDNPGIRYNIYSLDYGTYVDLIGTSKQPDLDVTEVDGQEAESLVPLNDKRSIRRIVLNAEFLARFSTLVPGEAGERGGDPKGV